MNTDILGKPITIDADRTVYVMLSFDRTHVLPDPCGDGSPWWSYNESAADVIEFAQKGTPRKKQYSKITLARAIKFVGEKQAKLSEQWQPALRAIAKHRKLSDKWDVYRRAKKSLGAHPILLDAELRIELKIT